MYQPYPSSGQSAGPLRPAAPAPVRTAVRLMYGVATLRLTGSALVLVSALLSVGLGLLWHTNLIAVG